MKRGKESMKEPCPVCEGSGQVSYFGGVSRFVITWDDCPECLGSGVALPEEEEKSERDGEGKEEKKETE